jgi:hypothetical protein
MSKEMNFRSGADREKLSDKAKADYDFYEQEAKDEAKKEEVNFRRFFEQRVTEAEDIMLRTPKPSMDGPKMSLTIDGKPVEPPTVWAREDLSPQQARDLRKAAEQKVVRDHEARLDQIEQTGEDKQRALLDRELGSRRYDRDRSYRDVGESGHDRVQPAAAATRGAADLGDRPIPPHDQQGSSLDPETVDDAYIQKVEAYQAEHEKESKGPPDGHSDERGDDELNFSGPESGAEMTVAEPEYEWTPERIAAFQEIERRHEAERSQDHDLDLEQDGPP